MAGKKISQLSSLSTPSLTGVTTVVQSGTTYKSSLQSLRNVLVDSGSHVFTGSQVINGDLKINGSLIADEYILSSSVTNITIQNVSGSSSFGNSSDDTHVFVGGVSITGSLTSNSGSFNNIHVSGSGSFNNIHVSGSGSFNNIHVSGSITSSYFVGDGSQLINLPSISGSTVNYVVGDLEDEGSFNVSFAGFETENTIRVNPKDLNGLFYSVLLEDIINYNQFAILKLTKGSEFATFKVDSVWSNKSQSIYRGYTGVINQLYRTNDPNINQIIIFKEGTDVDMYNETDDTNRDDFRVDGLSTSDTIIVLNMYGSEHELMSFSVIDPFFRQFVDKVLFNTGNTVATPIEAKNNFYNNFNDLISVIPPRILFSDFESVDLSLNYIDDGNDDQYDGGNYINTESQTNINYGNGDVVSDNSFGNGSSYVTVYQDSIFAMMAFNTSVNSVWFTGDLGADGTGHKNTSNLEKIYYYNLHFDPLLFSSNNITFNPGETWSFDTDFNGPNFGRISFEDNNKITTTWDSELIIQPQNNSLYLRGGDFYGYTGLTGGDVTIQGGVGAYSSNFTSNGGDVTIQGGSGGDGNNNGGNVTIVGGSSSGTGKIGDVFIGDDVSNLLSTTAKLNVYGGSEERNNLILATGNVDSYQGIVIKNFNDGNTASSDVVAIGDTGNEDSGYIDMGVNSSTYTGYTGVTALGKAGDAYLFSSANDLYIGNATPGKEVIIFNGGFETDLYSKIHIHDQGSIVLNGDTYTESAPESLRINGVPGQSYNLVTGENDVNSYSQINITNINDGDSASSDFVATADNGNESTFFIDLGINNSGFVQNGANVGYAGDGYMYSTGNDLLIGNASSGKKLIFFNGGLDSDANAVMYVHPDKSITINTPNVNPESPASLRIVNVNNTTSNIHAEANIDDFNEINNINQSTGTTASSDIVATNDLGEVDSTQGYIDMGINSTNYDVVGAVGGAGDAYLYSTGNHLHIGNGSTGSTSNLYFFVNGQDDNNIVQTILNDGNVGINNQNPEYQMDISGTTRIQGGDLIVTGSIETTQGFTGSLDYSNLINVPNGIVSGSVQISNLGYATTSSVVINVTGSSIYTNNPSTSNFSKTYGIFLGSSAGQNAEDAFQSNFIGMNAGLNAVSASNSNFIGSIAGQNAVSASNSNFIGVQSGQNATRSSNSNFIGNSSGINASDAITSNFIGMNAGNSASSASYSNFIGNSAGAGAVLSTYSNFIGYGAGENAVSASYSTLIGYRAGFSSTSTGIGTNNIIIGKNISLPDNTVNSINIGGVIFGSGTYASGGNVFSGSATNGKIGIKQSNPQYTFDVSGSGNYTDGLNVTGSLINNGFTVLSNATSSFIDDSAASIGGVPLYGLYRSGSFVMIRLT